jgi:hypothetical protein
MKCSKCGREYSLIFNNSCPYCNDSNNSSLFDTIFGPTTKKEETKENKKSSFEPFELDDELSEDEYFDDDDYDDFDNF